MIDGDSGGRPPLLPIGLILAATVIIVALHLAAGPGGSPARHVVRLVLTVALCWGLQRRHRWARWASVAIFGVAGSLGLVNLLAGGVPALLMGMASLAYLLAAVLLARSWDLAPRVDAGGAALVVGAPGGDAGDAKPRR